MIIDIFFFVVMCCCILICVFLDMFVSEVEIWDLFDMVCWVVFGGNFQLWNVYVVVGEVCQCVIDVVWVCLEVVFFEDENEFGVYFNKFWEFYCICCFELGEQMYKMIGILCEDKVGCFNYLLLNFEFFGVLVGIFFSFDKEMNFNQWGYLGMFIMVFMLVVEEKGLVICVQEVWMICYKIIVIILSLVDDQCIWCGFVLGYVDLEVLVNLLCFEWVKVEEFVVFDGF